MTEMIDRATIARAMVQKPAAYRSGGHPDGCGCGCESQGGLERVRFYPRQLIGADDLTQEQVYFRQKLRRHNRFLHGWGVACGCEVRAVPTGKAPWQVVICPGYVLTPQGDEVYVATEAYFDLATCLVQSSDPCAFSRPCPPVALRRKEMQVVYLAVRYIECEGRPQRVAPVGCGCDEADCENSRIYDAYEFCCLETPPGSHTVKPLSCEELCDGGIFPCPPCPDDGWVVLARVVLPGREEQRIAQSEIDNGVRRLLYSTADIQRLAQCTCRGRQRHEVVRPEPAPEPPPVQPVPGVTAETPRRPRPRASAAKRTTRRTRGG